MHKDRCLLYEAGEMPAEEAAEFERHLPGCAECRDWLETVRRAHGWAAALRENPAAVQARPGSVPVFSGTAGRFLGAAALAAALLLVRREAVRPAPVPGWDSSAIHERLDDVERRVDRLKGGADDFGDMP